MVRIFKRNMEKLEKIVEPAGNGAILFLPPPTKASTDGSDWGGGD